MGTIISFAGPDGVGKSTLAAAVRAELRRRNCRIKTLWFRWPMLLSAPLVLYARLRNLYDSSDVDERRGARAYGRSVLLRFLFPWAQAADCWIWAFSRARLPAALGNTVVADRFVLDVLVDTLLATGETVDQRNAVVRAFRGIHGWGAENIIVDAPWESVRSRQSDLDGEERWRAARAMYLALAREWALPVVENDGNPGEAIDKVLRQVLPPQRSDMERKYYLPDVADRVPLTRPILGNVVGAMMVHWLFQSLLYTDRTERLFKIGTDLLLGSLFFQLTRRRMSWPLASVLSFVGAHTVNFALNAQPVAVLHDLGLTRSGRQRLARHLSLIAERAREAKSLAWLGVYGSHARGEDHDGSDIDIRVRRRPGLGNAVAACLFLAAERTRATLARMPVDMYLCDSVAGLRRMGLREQPKVLVDKK